MIRRPRALPPGGTIGIVNPSSPVDPEQLSTGRQTLEARGYRTVVGPHVLDRDGHLAGRDEDRAADFMAFYADPAVDVLWLARGGYGSCRLWPHLDWVALAALPPKMVVGYSDSTALLIPLTQRVGVVALHGPVIFELAWKTTPAALHWTLKLLSSPSPAGVMPVAGAETLAPGTAEGELCGGCLSLIASTLGTPYQIETRGKLLLLEDIHESPPRIERYLVQLREAGILESAAGIIAGEATGADERGTVPMDRIWSEIVGEAGRPAVLGFPFGHVPDNYGMPLGIRARLDADARSVTILEAAVEA